MLLGYQRAEYIDSILCLKMYTESDYGGCLYLISLTFQQEEDVSPDDSENWLHLNVRLQGLMIFMSWHVLICLWQQEKKNESRKLQIVERAEKLIRDLLFITAVPFKKRRHSKLFKWSPRLSAFHDSNCIMRLSWSLAEFSTWKITGLAWASQNDAMFEVFVVVPFFFSFKY